MDNIQAEKALIAEFMGLQNKMGIGGRRWLVGGYWTVTASLKYNTSWDWLMPVCRKCLDITSSQIRPNVNACSRLDWLECEINTAMREYTIEPVYAAVVQFIKWHPTLTT